MVRNQSRLATRWPHAVATDVPSGHDGDIKAAAAPAQWSTNVRREPL